jgi:hypothetical protein
MSVSRRHLLSSVAGLVFSVVPALSSQPRPRVPPGRDPGGAAVAILGPGIDYRESDLAARLARDGEGELIGWDMINRDRQPFDAASGKTAIDDGGDASAVAKAAMVAARIVPVRIDAADAVSYARALAFVAATPARVAVLPIVGRDDAHWAEFRRGAEHFKDLLVIVPADPVAFDGPRIAPLHMLLENVLPVAVLPRAGFTDLPPRRPGFLDRTAPAVKLTGFAGAPIVAPAQFDRAMALGHVAALAVQTGTPEMAGAARKSALLSEQGKPVHGAAGLRIIGTT